MASDNFLDQIKDMIIAIFIMMSFAQALKSVVANVLSTGENGALQQASAASSVDDFNGLLAEIFLLMRNTPSSTIKEKLNKNLFR